MMKFSSTWPDPSEDAMETDEDPGSLFQWTRKQRTWVYLAGFLFFSAVIHGAGFYLFQVVYPSPVRVQPEQGRIAVLNPSEPAVRGLLQRLEDRTAFLRPPSEDADVRLQLNDTRIPFSPSFRDDRVTLREPVYEWSLPFTEPVGAMEPESAFSDLPKRIRLHLEGDLAGAEIAPWSLLSEYLNRAEWIPEMRLRISIDGEGVVEVLEVEGAFEEDSRAELVEVVESTLRFLPGQETASGWLRVHAGR